MAAAKTWRDQLAGVLEWSVVDKGMLAMSLIIPVYTQYLLWGLYTLSRPDRERLINVGIMHDLVLINISLLSGAIAIFLLGLVLRRKKPDVLWYQHLATQYFALSLVGISHYVGSMNFCAGMVLLGGPVFGFIVLDRRVIWPASIEAFVLMMVLIYATAFGKLPYAPVVVPPTDAVSNLFWINSYLSFAAPFLFSIVLLADQALAWWRKREDMIRELSRTDVLTGVHNRRSIMDMLAREAARTIRHGPPLSLVILDLDHFKRVNDTWGHPTGDLVLKEAANVIRNTIRIDDAVGRYGGEEFMILLPETELSGALALVERCRHNLAETKIKAENGDIISVSGSFGLASNRELDGFNADLLIKAADAALYRAKEGGRNRVESVVVGVATAL
jgi:diguanylate cyclase (GGDEF)-like protein